MRVFAAVILVGLLAACGGGDDPDRVLRLKTGDYTESELRADIRTSGRLTEANCATIKDLSVEEVHDVLLNSAVSGPIVQTPDADDDLRQAEIVLEECERAFY